MTPAERNKVKVKRILDDQNLLKAIKTSIAEGVQSLDHVLSEVQDSTQREALRVALSD